MMKSVAWIPLLLALFTGQSDDRPAFLREGDRIEQEFRFHRENLAQFFQSLRQIIQRDPPSPETPFLMRQLQDAPPQTGIYGYQVLPRLMEMPQPANSPKVSSFTYSWTTTEGYITGETTKLGDARAKLERTVNTDGDIRLTLLSELVLEYRNLLRNQRTIDQYIQYNRYWQRSIAQDKPRFDQLTELYYILRSGNPDTAEAIRKVLGKPHIPSFVRVRRQTSNRITVHVPVYTDIEDDGFLNQAKSIVETMWRAEENGILYTVEMEIRKVTVSRMYGSARLPRTGDHLDVAGHVSRFPIDGGVLTTGAEFTYGAVGRYVALGPGELTPRTFAHEFGHLLGFNDGYVRGYRDLGDRGFEILELTSFFDDIMSAPREGRVQPEHFRLILESVNPAAR
jgi:hypothetical protein